MLPTLGPLGTVHSVCIEFLIGCWLQDPHELHSLRHAVHGVCVIFMTNCWVEDSCGPHSLGPQKIVHFVCIIFQFDSWGEDPHEVHTQDSDLAAGG